MDLLFVVYRQYRWPFIAITLLSLLSAVSGIAVIAFINQNLIESVSEPYFVLGQLFGFILLLLIITLGSQLALTILGHHFVYQLRGRLVKQILRTDVAKINSITHSKLLASLSSDIGQITIAFVRLPELIQGIILTTGAAFYLGWLSASILLITALWLTITILLGWLLVNRVYQHLAKIRQTEDDLYQHYQAIINGNKELTLNRQRADFIYHQDYKKSAQQYRSHIIKADTYHLSAVNWSNIMMLGSIGLVFFLANGLGLANGQVAATFALTLLFIRTPLLQAIGALPTLLAAQVAFNKIASLELASVDDDVCPSSITTHCSNLQWQSISLQQVYFRYHTVTSQSDLSQQHTPFHIGPINLTINRGEQIFVIGGNGSGKSTLAMLLTGLYHPTSGQILVDGNIVDPEQYRALFSAVFTDFHLFDQLLSPIYINQENSVDHVMSNKLLDEWLERLQLMDKIEINNGKIANLKLSQGQRKRVALLLAVIEQRDIILLDEWAADQDPLYRRIFYQTLLPLLREMGKTVIAISHDDLYFKLADHLWEMRQGQLVELTGSQREQASHNAIDHLMTAKPFADADRP